MCTRSNKHVYTLKQEAQGALSRLPELRGLMKELMVFKKYFQ